MRRRRHALGFTHDSFLDVVSNVVGVLVLVAIAVILNAKDVKIDLGAPVLRDPPTAAARVVFECSGNRLHRLDDRALHGLYDATVARATTALQRKMSTAEVQSYFDRNEIGDASYRITLPDATAPALELDLRDGAPGENAVEILAPNSALQRELARIGPDTHWLFFIVRDDSFEVFRGARRIATERGFAVGWDPKERGTPLVFGDGAPGGVSVQW